MRPALWLLFACASGEGDTALVDHDGDGVYADADCDDADPRRRPGLEEECDRLDNDCDGLVDTEDDDLTDGEVWFADADGDGVGDGVSARTLCGRQDGYVGSAGDCDDTDPAVSTSSTWYADDDGDGYGDPERSSVACGAPVGNVADGTDCDDAAGGVNPGAEEICGDGVDQDCDGTPSGCGLGGDTVLPADAGAIEGRGELGTSLVALPDGGFAAGAPAAFDDDGEVAIHAWDGEAYAEVATVEGEGSAGSRLAALAGTGTTGLVVGGLTGVWILWAPSADTTVAAADASLTLTEGSVGGLAGVGDQDGDGVEDLLVGADLSTVASGYVVSGSSTGEVDLTLSLATITDRRAASGAEVAGLGDTDGDGLDDAALADGYGTVDTANQGIVYVLAGPVEGAVDLQDSEARVVGDQYGAGVGMVVAPGGDLDDDGYADLLLGAPIRDGTQADAGAAWIVPGPVVGSVRVAASAWALTGEVGGEGVGTTLAAGDIDGDGTRDVIVGGLGDPATPSYQKGEVLLWYGPLSGTAGSSAADARFFGETASDHAGWAVAGLPDPDGDGDDELLLGAPGHEGGAVYVFAGGAGL